MRQPFRVLTLALLGLLSAINLYRGATQAIAHDEALTYNLFVAAPWSFVFNEYNANNHVLYTILSKISVTILGLSEFSLRFPSLLSGLLYLWVVFRICERVFGATWQLPLAALLMSLNPYLLDFLTAARGYGMASAFFLLAFWEMLQWLSEPSPRHLPRAGVALALAVASNLVFVPPALGLAVMFLIAILQQRRWFQPAVTVSKKGTKKEEPNPYPTLGQAILRFIVPFVGVAWLILMYPLANASSQLFYVGATSLRASAESLVRSSLPIAPEWLIVTLALGVLPALLLGSAVLAWFAFSRWAQAALVERALLLTGGAMTFAFTAIIAAHLAFDFPYPEGRTGIYWIPLMTLTGLLIAHLWARATAFLFVPLAVCVAAFAAEFRIDHYVDWPYDADTKTILALIRQRKPAAPGRTLRIEGSWQFEPGLNFYRESNHLDWMAEFERATPKPGADYYVLLAQDAQVVNDLHLKQIFRGAHSGTILAEPEVAR